MATPLRLMWHANAPFVGSGYGKQTRFTLAALRWLKEQGRIPLEEFAISAHYGIQVGKLTLGDLTVYGNPRAFRDPFGSEQVVDWCIDFEANLLVTLLDVFALSPNLGANGFVWAPYFPVDHEPMPPQVLGHLGSAQAPIAMTAFGQDAAAALGLEVDYIPHMVPTNVYRPQPEVKRQARETLDLPNGDQFVFGMVANNVGRLPGTRKAFPEVFEALQICRNRGYNAALSLVAYPDAEPMGENLPMLTREFMVQDHVFFIQPRYLDTLFQDDPGMVLWYTALDAYLGPTRGEGFGVPLIEAASCGVPTIAHDCTAMAEVANHAGNIMVPKGRAYYTEQHSFQFMPEPSAIADAMCAVMDMSDGERTAMGAAGREHVIATYDMDHVAETFWEPWLIEMAEAMEPMPQPEAVHGV